MTKEKDILGDLLKNKENSNDSELNELLNFIENIGGSVDCQKQKRKKSRVKKPQKKRCSSYLSHENFEALDKVKTECQKMISKDKSLKISKSKITDISLEIILKDFQTNKENSVLAKKIAGIISKKQNG
jgi:hypothetical protein